MTAKLVINALSLFEHSFLLQKTTPEKRSHAIRWVADGMTISLVLIILQQELIRMNHFCAPYFSNKCLAWRYRAF